MHLLDNRLRGNLERGHVGLGESAQRARGQLGGGVRVNKQQRSCLNMSNLKLHGGTHIGQIEAVEHDDLAEYVPVGVAVCSDESRVSGRGYSKLSLNSQI